MDHRALVTLSPAMSLGALFPDDSLAALVLEAQLAGHGARLATVYAVFPGGIPPWFIVMGESGSHDALRTLAQAQSDQVPYLLPPESVLVSLECAGRDWPGEGRTAGAAIASALRAIEARTHPD